MRASSDPFVFVHYPDSSSSHSLPKAPADPVTFTYTVRVAPSAVDHTPGALLFRFDSEPVADAAITMTAIALAESGGESSSGTHALYQDVLVLPPPAVAMETLTIAHEGYWLI